MQIFENTDFQFEDISMTYEEETLFILKQLRQSLSISYA